MMVFTHVLMGALIGGGIGMLAPEFLPIAVYTGYLGGGFPDLDMVFTHRKTLHFPVLYSGAAAVAGGTALFWTTPLTIGLCCFLLAAAIHSLTDTLGGGKEMRPWRETDDRAVYNHVTQSWIHPRRLFYDGSGPDLVLSAAVAGGAILLLPDGYLWGVILTLAGAIVYTALRRWITRKISEDYQTFSAYIQHKLATMFDKV